jgi:hypothetical protein
MNKNTRNGLIVVAVVLVAAYFAYKKFVLPDSRLVITRYLDATFGPSAEHQTQVNSMEQGYVDAWSKALMNGQSTFTYNGKTYNTNGGTAA